MPLVVNYGFEEIGTYQRVNMERHFVGCGDLNVS